MNQIQQNASNSVRYVVGLVCAWLAMAGPSAQAQEEGVFIDPSPKSTTEIGPPPVANRAWEGSAQNTFLMEDGGFIPQKRSPWSVALFDWASVNMEYASKGEGRLETYNYLSFDYRLSWESKISVRPEFYLSGAGRNFFGDMAESEVDMGDIYLQYFHRNWALVELPIGEVGIGGAFRAYLPNGEAAKRQKILTKLQMRMMASTPLGNGLWLTYHFRPMYLVQSQKAYVNEFFNVKANENYRLEQRIELSKVFHGSWAIHQEIGTEHRWFYGSAGNNLRARTDGYFSLSTAASVRLAGVSLRGGVSYESKIAVPDRNPKLYNAGDTSYFLMTNLYF